MIQSQISAALAAVALLGALAGCAADPTTRASDDPTPTGNAMPPPHWPAECDEHVGEARDYAPDAQGLPTRDEALLAEAPSDAYHLVKVPAEPHRRTAWWIVAYGTNEIYAQVSAWHGDQGWLVDEVERCA